MKNIELKNIAFVFVAVICLSFPFFSYSKPALDMEVVYENAAYTINTLGLPNLTKQYFWDQVTYAHPPLYILTLSLFYKIFGFNLVSLRLVGFFAILFMAVLVYFLSQEIFKEEKDRLTLGLLGTFLYLSIPLVIQGSVYVEIDNALLPITMIIFVMAYIHFYREMNLKKLIFLGCLFTLALWAKITTSLILIIAVGTFHFLGRDFKEAFKRPLLIFLIGAFFFIITFGLYSSIINWKCLSALPLVFSVALIKNPEGAFYINIFTALKIILRLSLWLSPYLIFLWLIALKDSFKRIYKGLNLTALDFLSIYSCLILLGYLYFGGSHVLPRYHIPMIFAICVLATNSIKEIFQDITAKELNFYALAILFMIGYYVFIVKDMLYLTNYKFKVALAFDILNKKDLIFLIFKQIILYFLPLPLVFLLVGNIRKEFKFSKIILITLFILAISSNFGLNILQAKADYVTTEFYGTNGQKEIISFLKNRIGLSEGAKIIAPLDINYYLGKRDFPMDPYMELGFKYYPEKLLTALKDRRLKALVYNIPQLTVWQIRNVIRNENIQSLLKDEFTELSFGSYRLWLRKD